MSGEDAIQREVDRNYEAFEKMLPELMKTSPGKYVLLRHRKQAGVFETANDAFVFAETEFKDGIFSIQQVISEPADLGYFSRVAG